MFWKHRIGDQMEQFSVLAVMEAEEKPGRPGRFQ